MKEKFVCKLMGMEIVVRQPSEWPEELNDKIDIQLERAEKMILDMIEKEYWLPSDEEIKKDLL